MKRYIKSAVRNLSNESSDEQYIMLKNNYITRPEQLAELANSDSYSIRKEVARNPNTPADILKELSRDSAGYYVVGRNPSTPVEVLWEYAKDTEDCDRWVAVAENPNCPPEILEYLMHEPYVQYLVVVHPNTSIDTLKQIVANPNRYNVFDFGEDDGNAIMDKAKERLAEHGIKL